MTEPAQQRELARRARPPACLAMKRLDVFLGDAAAESGAGNFREIDVVVFGNLADERAGTDTTLVAVLGLAVRLRAALTPERAEAVAERPPSWLRERARQARAALAGGGRRGSVAISDDADYGVDLHGVAGLDLDLLQRAGRRSGDFGVNLVGGDFEQRLVALDFVARLLEPLGDGSFEDRFPHLGHDYVSGHGFLPWDAG